MSRAGNVPLSPTFYVTNAKYALYIQYLKKCAVIWIKANARSSGNTCKRSEEKKNSKSVGLYKSSVPFRHPLGPLFVS